MKYQVNYIDPTTGATSPIDTVDRPVEYTAEDYIRECRENADPEYMDMIHAGKITLIRL